MTLHSDNSPCPLIPIIWFRSVPPLSSLLSDSDGSLHSLVFPFVLNTDIKSLFLLHGKHYFWHTAGAQTCICWMHEFTTLIGNQDRCRGHGFKKLHAFLLSCVYFSPSEMECMEVCWSFSIRTPDSMSQFSIIDMSGLRKLIHLLIRFWFLHTCQCLWERERKADGLDLPENGFIFIFFIF